MRESDKKNSPFLNSHDKQILNSDHDEIVLWLYRRISLENETGIRLIKRITGIRPGAKILEVTKKIEYPLYDQRVGSYYKAPSIGGFADLAVTANKYCTGFVEVKTSVNIGETIRQINYYRQFENRGSWAVCSPPFKGSEVLEEQDIHFIPYIDVEDFL